ncbi:MAG: response regulator transcription factor [Deltaproteobacteria bacterium]|nr:response regulator transcription factor [Deltaproteobacteria bacterium]
MKAFSVVLADDHAMFRQGIRRILEELPGVKVLGESGDGLELLTLLKETKPDLVILDISMPNLRGMEAVREIKGLSPKSKILILTMHKEREYLYFALKAGVNGYLLKEDADFELLKALNAIRQDKLYVSPLLSEFLPGLLGHRFSRRVEFADILTDREKQILKLISEGKSSREIGELLYISARTVQNHRVNIMRKLNLKKTADLIKYAIQKGF